MNATIQPEKRHLTDEQLAHFKKKLLGLRKEVAEELEHEHEEIEVEREQRYDEIPAVSTDTVERMSTHELNLIDAIDEALERIDKGTYGICVQSGEPIPFDRLEAAPYADMTVEAEERQEALNASALE